MQLKIRTGVVAFCLLFSLLFISVTPASASSTTSAQNVAVLEQIQVLMQMLLNLKAELVKLQGTTVQGAAPAHSYTKVSSSIDGPVGVDISSPLQNFVYDKSNPLTDTIAFNWKVTNIPIGGQNTIVVETVRTELFSYSGAVGGFTWSGELPSGDSTGTYKLDISNQNQEGAGKYRARVKVRNCDFLKVNYCDDAHATFKTSPWVTYSIIDTAVVQAAVTPSVELRTEDISTDTFTTSPYTNLQMTVHPSIGSKVSTCRIYKAYSGGTTTETLTFNKVITGSDYGRTYALAVTDKGALQSVTVSCSTGGAVTVKDYVTFNVMQASLKKNTEILMNTRSIGVYPNATEIEMMTFCRGTIKAIEAGTERGAFKCYWGGEIKIDQAVGYKG